MLKIDNGKFFRVSLKNDIGVVTKPLENNNPCFEYASKILPNVNEIVTKAFLQTKFTSDDLKRPRKFYVKLVKSESFVVNFFEDRNWVEEW